MNHPVIIVGAGLSGLRAASLLTARGIHCKVLEARDRIGSRVLTASVSNKSAYGKFDLGPTWFWPQHEKAITSFVRELNIKTFIQYTRGDMLSERFSGQPPERFQLPETASPVSVRFKGGVQFLIDAVEATIPAETIVLR